MLKKFFMLAMLSCSMTSIVQANYQFSNFSVYQKPKKYVPRSYAVTTRKLRRPYINYQGWYGTIGSAVHLPFPSIGTQKSSTRSKPKDQQSQPPILIKNPHSSSAIPFFIALNEKNDIYYVTKFLFPLNIQLGYRLFKHVAFEGSLPLSLYSGDPAGQSILSLPHIAAKIIAPYNNKIDLFFKAGCVFPSANLKQRSNKKSQKPSRSGASKPTEIQYSPSKTYYWYNWIAAVGAEIQLNPKLAVHVSCNGMGSNHITERRRSNTITKQTHNPLFLKINFSYKFL